MKVIYDENLTEEQRLFSEECIQKSVKLAEDLINIWEEEDFQKMFKIIQDYQSKVQSNLLYKTGLQFLGIQPITLTNQMPI